MTRTTKAVLAFVAAIAAGTTLGGCAHHHGMGGDGEIEIESETEIEYDD
jgi:hypothetical protein